MYEAEALFIKEIHYYQIFEPLIKIGILSGYVSARNEKLRSYYAHPEYRKAVQWMLDLNNIINGDNDLKLFYALMTPISHINNSAFSVILNPFGEAYLESGNAEGTPA